jgi:hypothetical protein
MLELCTKNRNISSFKNCRERPSTELSAGPHWNVGPAKKKKEEEKRRNRRKRTKKKIRA